MDQARRTNHRGGSLACCFRSNDIERPLTPLSPFWMRSSTGIVAGGTFLTPEPFDPPHIGTYSLPRLRTMSRAFQMVDVFGSGAFSGNPLAVVHGADGLSADEMLAITRWLNLSETTFLLAPSSKEADYRVRIFTLLGELPFAGHPTLGSCHAWLSAGGTPRGDFIIQECGIGLVELRDDERLAFAAPPLIRSGPVDDAYVDKVAAVLGINPEVIVATEWVDNGPGWVASWSRTMKSFSLCSRTSAGTAVTGKSTSV